jgi:BirA family biotin operon repressor/biotin-[acetyl-CoA-carboxylase] ligase
VSAIVRADAEAIERLPLTAAVAACEAIERAVAVTCSIKWPNDIWIDERKVAGILIEARPQEQWAVVGIGLNVDSSEDEFPRELQRSATSLRIAAGTSGGRDRVLEALLERLAAWLSGPGVPGGETVLSAFSARDALYGRRIAWIRGEQRLEGEARGIDERGSLVVFTDDGAKTALDAGEVHLAAS